MDENDAIESLQNDLDPITDSLDTSHGRLITAQNSSPREETVASQNETLDSLIDSVIGKSPQPGRCNMITDDLSINDTDNDTEGGENTNPNVVDDLEDSTVVQPKSDKLCQLPLGSVKRIIKSDPDVPVINAESLFLITKATEYFLQWLGKEIYARTIRQKKKTIQLRDLNSAISEHRALEFLDGALD